MTQLLPRNRVILAVHRWLGAASAAFLVTIALTGLALNHAERLGMDRIVVHSPLLLSRYGMTDASSVASFRIGEADTLSHLDGRLYFNGLPLAPAGRPVGIAADAGLLVIVTADELVTITPGGELVERAPRTGAPPAGTRPPEPAAADPDMAAAVLSSHQGEGLTLHRVVLDLHSGRLFGWGGRTLMDLTAVAILLLVSSGVSGWMRKSRAPGPQ